MHHRQFSSPTTTTSIICSLSQLLCFLRKYRTIIKLYYFAKSIPLWRLTNVFTDATKKSQLWSGQTNLFGIHQIENSILSNKITHPSWWWAKINVAAVVQWEIYQLEKLLLNTREGYSLAWGILSVFPFIFTKTFLVIVTFISLYSLFFFGIATLPQQILNSFFLQFPEQSEANINFTDWIASWHLKMKTTKARLTDWKTVVEYVQDKCLPLSSYVNLVKTRPEVY